MQSKLLHVLQDRKYHRVGGQKEVQVKARLIAATNQDLDNEIITGNFREDLYYRLTTITIHIPPLRERKEDIDYLIEYFIQKFQIKHGIPKINIPSRLLELFYEYQWPGNIRELENYLKRLSVLRNFRELEEKICKSIDSYNSPKTELADKKTITPEPAEFEVKLEDNSFPSLKEVRDQAVRRVENMIIRQALEETHWNRKKVAKILKISYRALLYKMKDMNITPTYK
jgi:DNA-binding NtrC family response regulator